MLKKILISIFLLFYVFVAESKPKSNKGILYEVTHPMSGKKGYFMGTIHISDKRVMDFSDSVLYFLDKTEVFANEINMDSLNPMSLISYAMLPKDSGLSVIFTPDEFDKINKAIQAKMQMPLMMFENIKPVFLYFILLQDKMSKGNTEEGEAMDIALLNFAKQKGKQIKGLEQPESQFSLLSSLPLNAQKKMLLDMLESKDEDSGTEDLEPLIKAYLSDNQDKINKEISKANTLFPDFEKKFLTDRNHIMAKESSKILNSQSAFFAVGAAHLIGKENIIEILSKQGYKPRRVNTQK